MSLQKLTAVQASVMGHIYDNDGVMPLATQNIFSKRTYDSLEKRGLLRVVSATLVESMESVSEEIALQALELHNLKEDMYITPTRLEDVCADAYLLGNPPTPDLQEGVFDDAEKADKEAVAEPTAPAAESTQPDIKKIAGKIAKCLALAESDNPHEPESAKDSFLARVTRGITLIRLFDKLVSVQTEQDSSDNCALVGQSESEKVQVESVQTELIINHHRPSNGAKLPEY